MKSLAEDGSIKQSWSQVGPANPPSEFPVSSAHESIKAACLHESAAVPLDTDTDPLMWWKEHVQEVPRLTRMARQMAVPASSVSPERLFSSAGLVQGDLRG